MSMASVQKFRKFSKCTQKSRSQCLILQLNPELVFGALLHCLVLAVDDG